MTLFVNYVFSSEDGGLCHACLPEDLVFVFFLGGRGKMKS